MKLRYDKPVDAAYLYVADEESVCGPLSTHSLESESIDGMINLDFDANERLVGIEIIPASKFLSPAVLARAS